MSSSRAGGQEGLRRKQESWTLRELRVGSLRRFYQQALETKLEIAGSSAGKAEQQVSMQNDG